MKTLSIDLETFSDVDLNRCGVYRYTESPVFEILLFGYAKDDEPVHVIDLASGESIPMEILDALTNKTVIKWSFNASFERICLSAYMRKYFPGKFLAQAGSGDTAGQFLNPDSWRCSLIWSACLGLPLSLKGAGAALGL